MSKKAQFSFHKHLFAQKFRPKTLYIYTIYSIVQFIKLDKYLLTNVSEGKNKKSSINRLCLKESTWHSLFWFQTKYSSSLTFCDVRKQTNLTSLLTELFSVYLFAAALQSFQKNVYFRASELFHGKLPL